MRAFWSSAGDAQTCGLVAWLRGFLGMQRWQACR
jgi:hypothetical protein